MLDKHQTESFWFLNNHVTVAVSRTDGTDGISVLDLRVPPDEAPPFHIHHEEDEIFHILEGEVRFRVGDSVVTRAAGATVLAPRGVPHGFRVVSPDGARFLTVTQGGFEAMVRTMARPALSAELPPQESPSPDMQARLAAVCAAHRIDVLGPPID